MQLRRWLSLSGAVVVGLLAAVGTLGGLGRTPAAEAGVPLVTNAVLAGRVTVAQSGSPISLVAVSAYDAVSLALLGSTPTDPQGFYTLPVSTPYGAVKLQFASELRFPTVWYLNQTTLASATPVTLTAPTIANLNMALQAAGGLSLTITVGGQPPAPSDFIDVEVFDASGHFVGSLARSSGVFLGGFLPGGYRLRYTGGRVVPQWHGGAATFTDTVPLTLTVGATNTLSVDLAPSGVITGHITDAANGQPLDLATVEVFDEAGFWLEGPSFAYSVASGVYTIGGLSTGGYRLRFEDEHYAPQYYHGRANLNAAEVITVTAGQVRANVDIALERLGSLAGTLTLKGEPIAAAGAVQVTAYRPGTPEVVGQVLSQPGGGYVLRVPAGSVELRFTGPGFVPEWYNNQPIQPVATVISVSAGVTQTQLNVDLSPANGCLDGTVSDPGGPVQFVYVHLLDSFGQRLAAGSTDTLGHYFVCGLAPGQYKVEFALYPYAIEWNSDKASAAAADPVVVQAGQTTTVNAVLDTVGGCLTGDLRGPAGVGERPGRRQLQVRNAAGETLSLLSQYAHVPEQTFQPQLMGMFALCGLPPGTYTVIGWDDHNVNGRLDGDEQFTLGGATLTPDHLVAQLRLALPAPHTYVPFMLR